MKFGAAVAAIPSIWLSAASAKEPQYVLISSPSVAGVSGDYFSSGKRHEERNLIKDVLGCGFKKIEVISDPDVTDGGEFAIRVRKDRWLEAAMPCLKKNLPGDFVIIDDRTMED